MQDAHDDEYGDGGSKEIAAEHGGKHRQCKQIERLAFEGIHHVARERTHAQGSQGVARDDGTDDRVARLEILLDEERQHRQQQVERKEKQKVSSTKAQVVLIEKFLFHDTPKKTRKDTVF